MRRFTAPSCFARLPLRNHPPLESQRGEACVHPRCGADRHGRAHLRPPAESRGAGERLRDRLRERPASPPPRWSRRSPLAGLRLRRLEATLQLGGSAHVRTADNYHGAF